MSQRYSFARQAVAILAWATLCVSVHSQLGHAQPTGIEPQAEKILRRMSEYLAKQQQFSVRTEVTLEAVLASGQRLQFDGPATATVSRPNRFRADRKGDLVSQEFFYDGKTLTLYNPKENLYASSAAPSTLEEMLDYAREKLDVIAPASELLYHNAAERMLKESSSGFVVGQSAVAGVKCTHLAFRGAEVDWQIWVQDGARPLPCKFMITSTKINGAPQFTVWMRSWDLAPKLSDRAFSFVPPKGAKKIEFLTLTTGTAKSK